MRSVKTLGLRVCVAEKTGALPDRYRQGGTADLHSIAFCGHVLCQGFWIYVWKVTGTHGECLYVGMTGDASSRVAQSPFSRISGHLGRNKNSNALHRHLTSAGIDPTKCAFEFAAYGPIYPNCGSDPDEFKRCWSKVAALERRLSVALSEAGHPVMNQVRSLQPLSDSLWRQVRDRFAPLFPGLLEENVMTVMQQARLAWPVLIALAKTSGEPITYGELARKIGTSAQSVRHPLNVILGECDRRGWPKLHALVVNARTRVPGPGYGEARHAEDLQEVRKFDGWNPVPPF
jgi:hypothetical protein